jgi:hypothetical protein
LWHYFRQKQGQSVQEYTTKFIKMAIMLGISPKNPDVLLKYLGRLHSHLQNQVMFFKPRIVDKACVQVQCLENIGHKKGQPSNSKQKDPREASKEAKKKWKGGRDKKMIANIHQYKDHSNHFNHCNIYGHTKEKCWKLHLELNLKNHKKDAKKKNILATNSSSS